MGGRPCEGRRAGHAILARALAWRLEHGGSRTNPFLKRLVEIDGLIAVHGRAEAGCPPLREGLHFPLPENPKSPKCTVLALLPIYGSRWIGNHRATMLRAAWHPARRSRCMSS